MKKLAPILLILLFFLAACSAGNGLQPAEPDAPVQLGNPWKSYDTMADAEAISGLSFPVPANIPEGYVAESYRVMNSSLLEVIYRSGEAKIVVRMQSGNDPDISGVYETFHRTETTEQNGASVIRKEAENCLVYLILKDEYSFSIYATGPTSVPACEQILACIC